MRRRLIVIEAGVVVTIRADAVFALTRHGFHNTWPRAIGAPEEAVPEAAM